MLTWVFGGFWCALPLLTPRPYVIEGFMTTCSFDYFIQGNNVATLVIIVTFIFAFAVPVALTVKFYILIYIYLKKSEHQIMAVRLSTLPRLRLESKTIINKDNVISKSKKISRQSVEVGLIRSSFMTVVIFVLLWLPYGTITMIAQFSPNRAKYLTPNSMVLPTVIAKSSAALNPIVYAFSNKKFLSDIKKKLYKTRFNSSLKN
jgi:hypothetical protein